MSTLRKFSASIFAGAAYALLYATGWKRKTVEANLRHVLSAGESGAVTGLKNTVCARRNLYKKMLWNLTHHVGELLFCFDSYKNLPCDVADYPYKVDDCFYELAEGSAAVIKKMRHGGIFLTAHYGNYEASGAWLCALGAPLKASFIPLKPAWLNRYIYEKVRCVRGRPYSIDAKNPRDFLRILDSGELFCLLADQDSRISSAITGKFLGCNVHQNPVPDFLLKHRPYTPIFFCWIEESDGKQKTGDKKICRRKILHALEAKNFFLDSASPDNNFSDIASGKILNVSRNGALDAAPCTSYKDLSSAIPSTKDFYHVWLEARIKENPALWYGWTHKRFKSMNPEIYQ